MRIIAVGVGEDQVHGAGREEGLFLCACDSRRYVELPLERAQPGMCAKFHKSPYGTRDAALNGAQAYPEVLEGMGFVKASHRRAASTTKLGRFAPSSMETTSRRKARAGTLRRWTSK